MTACACPGCGGPVPLTVASLGGIRCRSCGFVGPAPSAVQQRLQMVQHELGRVDTRAHQFDERARSAIRRALGVRWAARVLLVIGASPCLAIAAYGIVEGAAYDGPNRIPVMLVLHVPLLIYVAVGHRLDARVVRARRELLEACAAVPPVHPGEPAACSVCGAPLVAQGVDPFVRCRHCAADNVVHPAAMAQAAARRTFDLDALTAALVHRARAILATAWTVTMANVVLVVGTPFFGFASILAVLLLSLAGERVLEPAPCKLDRYAWLETNQGTCIGLVSRHGDRTVAHLGKSQRTLDEEEAERPRFPADHLVGRRVVTARGAVGVVQRTMGAPVTNEERLVLDTGARSAVVGTCELPD